MAKVTDLNRLSILRPDLAAEWDPANPFGPETVSVESFPFQTTGGVKGTFTEL